MRTVLLAVMALLTLAAPAAAADYYFVHNNDSIIVKNAGGNAEVAICSVSNKSGFTVTCNGNSQTHTINRDSSNEWKSRYSCKLSGNEAKLTITVRETGKNKAQGTVGPENTDLVVHVIAGTVENVQCTKHGTDADTKASGDAGKCNWAGTT